MMTDHAKKPVSVEIDTEIDAVFTASHHHVVGDRNDTVDTIRMSGELVAVQSVLVLAGKF